MGTELTDPSGDSTSYFTIFPAHNARRRWQRLVQVVSPWWPQWLAQDQDPHTYL